MRYLIIGAGRMAAGAVHDLLGLETTSVVYVSDWKQEALTHLTAQFKDARLQPFIADAGNQQQMQNLMAKADGVFSAASYAYNYNLTRWAIACHCHFVDLGGNNTVVQKQFNLDKEAKTAGVGIIPDCGLAPGMVSVVAADAVGALAEVSTLQIRVGGLPLEPKTPLNYQLIFSVKGLINEYIEEAVILKNGRKKTVPSMTAVETLVFPAPFGKLEAFYTSGGTSTLPDTYQNRIKQLDYKTIRYPGHCALFKAMIDLGFTAEKKMPIVGSSLSRREVFERLLEETLTLEEDDVSLIRVTARGKREGRLVERVYQAIEYPDIKNKLSAMMRTTAFPAVIALEMLVDGRIADKGVLRQEISIPPALFMKELAKRNIKFDIGENTVAD